MQTAHHTSPHMRPYAVLHCIGADSAYSSDSAFSVTDYGELKIWT